MAKTGDYIKLLLSKYGVSLSADEFTIMLLNNDINQATDYTKDQAVLVDTVIYNIIPQLLLMPDESVGDASQKWDRNGIKAFYSIIAKKLGLPDLLAEGQPIIVDKSYLW